MLGALKGTGVAKLIEKLELKMPSDSSRTHIVEETMECFFFYFKIDKDTVENFGISVTEMFNNAIKHGNENNKKKSVFVSFEVYENQIKAIVLDEGKGFNPNKVADPLSPENIYKESGRGIFIVKNLMDNVDIQYTGGGTKVVMIKYR